MARITNQMRAGWAQRDFGAPATGLGDHVEHVCYECGGGQMTNTQAGLNVPCNVCHGRGTLTNEEMDRIFPG